MLDIERERENDFIEFCNMVDTTDTSKVAKSPEREREKERISIRKWEKRTKKKILFKSQFCFVVDDDDDDQSVNSGVIIWPF